MHPVLTGTSSVSTRHRLRRILSWLGAAGAAAMIVLSAPLPVRGASPTSISITGYPDLPFTANSIQTFTAEIVPPVAGRTVDWEINGVMTAQSTTDASGTTTFEFQFGPGGYLIGATLEGGPDWDWARATDVEVEASPDPEMEADSFSAEQLEEPTVAATGADARIAVARATTANVLSLGAVDIATGKRLDIYLRAPEGSAVEPGVYLTISDPQVAFDVRSSYSSCGSPSTGGTTLLSLRRDPAGVVIAVSLVYWFQCEGALWPTVGWVRYNDIAPVSSVSLPSGGGPWLPSVPVGGAGSSVPYSMVNDGETTLHVGSLSTSGPDAGDFGISADSCSGATIAPAERCTFGLVFAPSGVGIRSAHLVIPTDLPLFPRSLMLGGQALVPTAITAPTVTADQGYLADGVRYEASLSPNPMANSSECLVDGAHVDGSSPSDAGLVFCLGHRPAAGTHTVRVHWPGDVTHAEAWSPVTSFSVDPTTTTSIAAAPPSAGSNVPVKVTATVAFGGDVSYGGGTLTVIDETTDELLVQGPVRPGSATLSVSKTFTTGVHHLVAQYAGVSGLEAPSTSATDVTASGPDMTAPHATAPATSILAGTGFSVWVPVRVRWTGSDTGSWVVSFAVRYSVDGGSWRTISSSLTSGLLDRFLATGHRYRFSVRPLDAAGNWGGWIEGPSLLITQVQDASLSVRYAGRWVRSTSTTWWGGTSRWSTSAGATASMTFTGRAVGWVSAIGPGRGKARVYVNGALVATIDLGASALQARRVVWSKAWSTSATRTITVRVSGTAGRPRVDVDGFVLVR